jgi:hypothetical protein
VNKVELGEAVLKVIHRRFPKAILEDPHSGESFRKRSYRFYIPEIDENFVIPIIDIVRQNGDRTEIESLDTLIRNRLDDFCR